MNTIQRTCTHINSIHVHIGDTHTHAYTHKPTNTFHRFRHKSMLVWLITEHIMFVSLFKHWAHLIFKCRCVYYWPMVRCAIDSICSSAQSVFMQIFNNKQVITFIDLHGIFLIQSIIWSSFSVHPSDLRIIKKIRDFVPMTLIWQWHQPDDVPSDRYKNWLN